MGTFNCPFAINITFIIVLISIITLFYGCLNDDFCVKYTITQANIIDTFIVNDTCVVKKITYDCYKSIISLKYNKYICNIPIKKSKYYNEVNTSLDNFIIGNYLKIYVDRTDCLLNNDSTDVAIVSIITYPFVIISLIYTIRKYFWKHA